MSRIDWKDGNTFTKFLMGERGVSITVVKSGRFVDLHLSKVEMSCLLLSRLSEEEID